MSELVHMRQRMRAVETIKKITHAMRLIAMSAHARLKHKEGALRTYESQLERIFDTLHHEFPEWRHPIFTPHAIHDSHPLIIIVGSQKGLCGSFNASLAHYVRMRLDIINERRPMLITIGKRITELIKESHHISVSYDEFSIRLLDTLVHTLMNTIMHTREPFTSVTLLSNEPKSFFVQRPHSTVLIPISRIPNRHPSDHHPREGYLWKQPPHEVLTALAQQYIQARLEHILAQSLLAEHAARFISMDNSTRNARTLLENTRLEYNKLRQARITKELTELTGSYT